MRSAGVDGMGERDDDAGQAGAALPRLQGLKASLQAAGRGRFGETLYGDDHPPRD